MSTLWSKCAGCWVLLRVVRRCVLEEEGDVLVHTSLGVADADIVVLLQLGVMVMPVLAEEGNGR